MSMPTEIGGRPTCCAMLSHSAIAGAASISFWLLDALQAAHISGSSNASRTLFACRNLSSIVFDFLVEFTRGVFLGLQTTLEVIGPGVRNIGIALDLRCEVAGRSEFEIGGCQLLLN